MSTEGRGGELEELYRAAEQRPPAERASFLDAACPGNPELRRKIELLLDQTRTVAGPGALLGPYRLESVLGQGGMGQVYRAVDTRLNRSVALKICGESFGDRFEREARAIAALNHSNICTLYDVGPNYLVMELVEGETLSLRLKRGPLPLGEVVRYGAQIADALSAAHSRGIVHRDLKPGNIMLAKSGVKVLDFGLAKSAGDQTITDARAVVGTPAYMAPEQLEGRECDGRTDIYALGLVLREMATGRRPGVASASELPVGFAHVVHRCLEQSPDDRWQSARDVKAELEWVDKIPVAQITRPRPWKRRAALSGGVLIAVLAGLAWWRNHREGQNLAPRTLRLEMKAPPGVEVNGDSGLALSPDGRHVAFVGRSAAAMRLWVRPLDSGVARELPGTDGATFPFWSPDSRTIGFFAAGKLQRVDTVGGSPSVIFEGVRGRGGTWNNAGDILFNAVNDGPILKVNARGGKAEPVTKVDKAGGENSHRWPVFLPDGRRFLYLARATTGGGRIFAGSLDRPEEKIEVARTDTSVALARSGESAYLLWAREGILLMQKFNERTVRVEGPPVRAAEGVAISPAGSYLSLVSASLDGVAVWHALVAPKWELTRVSRNGAREGAVGVAGAYRGLRLSPDGRRVALDMSSVTIWQLELARGIPTQLGTRPAEVPIWSPDGERIVFRKGGPPNLYGTKADGSGAEERLLESHDSNTPLDWSPDGNWVLYHRLSNDISAQTRSSLWLWPTRGGEPRPYLQTSHRQGTAAFSPDGKWVAYASDESGRDEIYVQSFPAGGPKWQVSSAGGNFPRWRRDGLELFYLGADRKLMSVTVRRTNGRPDFAGPAPLFPLQTGVHSIALGPYTYPYDVAPDGNHFVVLSPVGEVDVPAITVATGWAAVTQKQ
jgi:Tol biopolymer transport system component